MCWGGRAPQGGGRGELLPGLLPARACPGCAGPGALPQDCPTARCLHGHHPRTVTLAALGFSDLGYKLLLRDATDTLVAFMDGPVMRELASTVAKQLGHSEGDVESAVPLLLDSSPEKCDGAARAWVPQAPVPEQTRATRRAAAERAERRCAPRLPPARARGGHAPGPPAPVTLSHVDRPPRLRHPTSHHALFADGKEYGLWPRSCDGRRQLECRCPKWNVC